ncbi:MAG: zinc ribbon domain-containing protein [Candidatus Omnitrophica bacterium]|nr:zinc ribbon domain-containing protein [Candidatus Omnitrophota bacterium]
MNLNKAINSLELFPKELEALAQGLGIRRNPLCTLAPADFTPEEGQAILSDFNKLPPDERNNFTSAVRGVFNPVLAATYEQSTGEDELVRSLFAWDPKDTDHIAVLMNRGAIVDLSQRTFDELKAVMAEALVVDEKLRFARILIKLSPFAAIVLLAVFDYFRLERYRSLLKHTAPGQNFVIAEIKEIIDNSWWDDFRWPLNFVEKVMPADLSAGATLEKIQSAMDELEKTGFILSTPPEAGETGPAVYTLTDAALIVNHAMATNISKIAVTVSSPRPDKQTAYETLLFVRDANYLILFDITGEIGIVTTLDMQGFDKVMDSIFKPTLAPEAQEAIQAMEPMLEEIASAPAQEATGARCNQCQAPIGPGIKFCASCGAPVQEQAAPAGKKFCPGCGQQLNVDAKFCNGCGTAL